MKKWLLLLLLVPAAAFASNPARFDLPVITTTPSTVPAGSLPSLLAVTNATVNVCGYPAVVVNGMCTNTITTYTDSTLSTACPSTAQLTAPGTSVCISTTGLQGTFGFWYDAAAQTHMTYTVQTSWGTYGPYDIAPGSSSGGGSGTVTNVSSGNLSALFSTSVANPGTTPALSFTPTNFAAHTFYGNNGGSTASPSGSLIGASDWSVNSFVAGGGSAQLQTVTLTPAPSALVAGLEVRWLPVAANTATGPTLDVNGLGAKAITKLGTTGLVAGDLTTTAVADAIYDGTRWQLQNPQTASASAGVASINGNTGAMTFNGSGVSQSGNTFTFSGGSGSLPTAPGAGSGPVSTAAGASSYAATQIMPFDATYTFFTAATSACTTPATTGTYTCARNEATGAIQFSGTDAAVVINDALAQIYTTGGELYFKNGTYNFNSATAEIISPYTTLSYCVGIPSTNAQNYPDIFFVGESRQDGYTGSSGVLFNVTTAAETAAGSNKLAAFWMRPSTDNSRGFYWNSNIHFKNVTIDFPNNQHGNEIQIDTLEAAYLSTENVGTGFATTETAVAAAGDVGIVTPGTPSNGDYLYNTAAEGSVTGIEIDTEHSVVVNSVGFHDTNAFGYGIEESRNADPIGHGVQMIHAQSYLSINSVAVGPYVLAGNELDIVGLDVEYLTTGTPWVYGGVFVATGGGNLNGLGGFISWSNALNGVLGTLTSPFPSGQGLNFVVQQDGVLSANTVNATISNNTPGVAASTMTNDATGDPSVQNFLAPNATVSQINLGTALSAGNSAQMEFYSAGNDNPGSAGILSIWGAAYPPLAWFGNGGVRIGGASTTPPAQGLAVGSANQMQVAASGNITGPSLVLTNPYSGAGGAEFFDAYVPGLTAGGDVYSGYGVANATTNAIIQNFHYTASGGSNYDGWYFPGNYPSLNVGMYSNLSTVFGATTPGTAGPANGISVGSLNQFQVDGSGNTTLATGTAATSSANANSPNLLATGHYWNGTASANDAWTCFDDLSQWTGSPTNPPSDLTCNHSGTSGVASFKVSNIIVGNLNATVNATFNSAAANALSVNNGTYATSGANQSSPLFVMSGNYWTGSGNSQDVFSLEDSLGSGSNPSATLTLAHSGTPGATSVDLSAVNGVKLPNYTVAGLPSAPAVGTVVVVTDASTFTPGTCTGGGSDVELAISSGSAWVCQ